MRRTMILLFSLSALASCASAPAPTGRARFDSARITREELVSGQFSNAYDAVKTLRGSWLNAVRPESFRYPSAIQIYLDNVRIGDVTALSSVESGPIQYIRFYNAQDATARWGTDHGAGAIYISTRVERQGAGARP